MLSYRHGYHAGNHADVLKHLVLLALLQKMRAKDKPFIVIDSHAGNGVYRLDSVQARKTREVESGILPLWQQFRRHGVKNPLLQSYLNTVANLDADNAGETLAVYPGSPTFSQSQLREQDRMILMELHSSEIEELRQNFHYDRRIAIHHRDGFEGAVALSPPTPRRGLMLIDPAYEDKEDYDRVIKTVREVHRRWATGVIAVWFPMLGRARDHSPMLIKALSRLPGARVMTLAVSHQTEEFGMHGSGMLLVNTPWQFGAVVDPAMNEVVSCLAGSCPAAEYRVIVGA
jgi:23S rRNA (adenine2030-N6)-methyltransferase